MNYRLAYAIGFHPWEDLAEHPPYAGKLLDLVAREEDDRERPYGTALDIGTGSAVWGVRLAQRGWEVTGVDIIEKSLARARRRAEEEGVEIRLVRFRVGCVVRFFHIDPVRVIRGRLQRVSRLLQHGGEHVLDQLDEKFIGRRRVGAVQID